MATQRRSPQYSIALKPELQAILDNAVQNTGLPKATLLYQAVRQGLLQIADIQQHQISSPDDLASSLIVYLQQFGYDAFTPGHYYDISDDIYYKVLAWFKSQQLPQVPATSSRVALFYLGRQMYRDRLPMPTERELMLGWRFERDMQVELEERLNNLEGE
jgi:predicted DNA-binding protein